MQNFLHSMIDYFEATDLDPSVKERKIPEELAIMQKELLSAIKEARNTYVAFIREQEKTKLGPMIKQINDITETFLHYLRDEALRRSDLEMFTQNTRSLPVESLTATSRESSVAIGERTISQTDYDRMLKRMCDLFEAFLKNGKRSTFGAGLGFDNAIIQRFQMEFSKLKY